jgi:hypothetical protein
MRLLKKFGLLAFFSRNGTCLHRLKLTSGRTSLLAARNRETVLTIATAKIGVKPARVPNVKK